jgi:hypothetical protein
MRVCAFPNLPLRVRPGLTAMPTLRETRNNGLHDISGY